MDRGIAEQHVGELPGVVADGGRRERNPHLEQALAHLADVEHAADDLAAHVGVVDRLGRHLDALLDGDGAGAFCDHPRIAADAIDRLDVQRHDKGTTAWEAAQRPGTLTAGRAAIGAGASRRIRRWARSAATMAVTRTATMQSQTTKTPSRPSRTAAAIATKAGTRIAMANGRLIARSSQSVMVKDCKANWVFS